MMFTPGTYWMIEPMMGLGSSSKGSPYIYIEGDITHIKTGTDAEGQATYDPVAKAERRTVFLYLSDKAFGWTAEKLDALGWNGDFKAPALDEVNAAGIWVNCAHEQYNGQPKERWSLSGNGGGIEHKSVEADVVRKLNAMYAQRKKAAASAKPKSPPATKEAVGPDGKPIPF